LNHFNASKWYLYFICTIGSWNTNKTGKENFAMEQPLNILLMGERLRAFRVSKKQTMKEFAELCGISERYLADIERGVKAPKLETFVRIVNAAGVSPEYLLQDSLTKVDKGNLVRDTLNILPPEQQALFQDFILGLVKSMGQGV